MQVPDMVRAESACTWCKCYFGFDRHRTCMLVLFVHIQPTCTYPGSVLQQQLWTSAARDIIGFKSSKCGNELLQQRQTWRTTTDFESDDGLLELQQTQKMTTNFESDNRLWER